MKNQFFMLWGDTVLRRATKLTISLIAVMFIAIGLVWSRLPAQIPLYYSRPWGSLQLGNTLALFLLPISACTVLAVNLFLVVRMTYPYWVLTRVTILCSLLFTCLSLITTIQIVLLMS